VSREGKRVVNHSIRFGAHSNHIPHNSYDGQLRLFDARQPLRPLSTTQAGGGIWRIKWHPSKANLLLLGCMHDGFKVMQLDSLLDVDADISRQEMQLHTRFDEHESLAYGCDWDRGKGAQQDYIYSCSFYDSTWHAWAL
jgi:diphthamide biosynthesis protein 7